MAATIKIKNSSTTGAVPTSSDLVQGELAVNVTDKRIFTENASGTVVELGTNPSILTIPDGSASAPTLTNDGDTNTGIFFPAADTVGITTGGTERARVDSSGNMGVGVTPSAWSGFTALQIQNGALFTDSTSFRSIMNGYYNGSNWIYNTSNYATRYEQLNGIHRWFNAASGTAGNTISFTQAMTLDASGNLLVGTTSALYGAANRGVIEVNGSSTAIVALKIGNSYGGYTYHDGTVMSVSNVVNGALAFATNGTERARLDSSGNLLVGTTSNTFSSAKGLITGSQTSGGQGIYDIYNSDSTTASDPAPVMTFHKASTTTTSSARFLQFYANAATTPMGGIVGNGSSNVQFASISDIREKTNIQNINGSLAKINALRPVEFDWIADGSHVPAGFVAQEVEQVFPEFVVENMSNDGQEERKGLTGGMTGGIVAHLVKAIQEQQAIITQLQADVAALKG